MVDVPAALAPTSAAEAGVPSASAPEAPVTSPAHTQEELVEAALAGRLRELVDPPDHFSFSAFALFEHCPLAYALKYLCGLEVPEPVPAFVFGRAAHRAFELFTAERRGRAEAGEAPPVRADLERCFEEAWAEADFGDDAVKAALWPRVSPMLDAFWAAEAQRQPATIGEETPFRLAVELPDGVEATLTGVIDRLDRRADGSVDLIDYKTGDAWGPMANAFNLQLAIYALGCRDALGLGAPRRALLFFVEHGLFAVKPVSGERLEETRREIADRAAAIRGSDFAPTPSEQACRWCDFRELCTAREDLRQMQ